MITRKDVKRDVIMNSKKQKSTYEQFVEKLSAGEKREFDQEYKDLLLSELILAAMERDEISVRELAKMAGVSPTIVQSMRSNTKNNYSLESFHKILTSLGYNQFMVGRDGHFINIDLSQLGKR